MIYPQDRVVDFRLKGFDATVKAALDGDPAKAKLFADSPGLLDAVISAGRETLREHLAATGPALQQRLARLYAQNFSPADIDQLIAFYSGPTGSKLIAGLHFGPNLQRLVAAAGPPMDKRLTAEQQGKFEKAAKAQNREQFTAEDQKALAAFASTPVHAKLGRLKGEFGAIIASAESGLDAEINKSTEATVTSYIAAHGERQVN